MILSFAPAAVAPLPAAPQAQLMDRNTLPLLRQLAALLPEGAAVAPSGGGEVHPLRLLRPAIARVVQALAEGPGVALPEAERERWSEQLLQWLVQARTVQQQAPQAVGGGEAAAAAETADLMRRLVAALSALAAPAGSAGLHVAHAWLAELIVALSHQVQPYTAVASPEASTAAAASSSASEGAGPDAAASTGWWAWGTSKWWGGGSGVVAAPGPAPADAPLGAGQAADGMELAMAGGASSSPYPSLDEVPLSAGGGGAGSSSSSSNSISSGSSSWWRRPSAWLPTWAGGTPPTPGQQQQQLAEAAAVRTATAGGGARPSDSELALYINAAAVGPVYARSVAAALLDASGRVGECCWCCCCIVLCAVCV